MSNRLTVVRQNTLCWTNNAIPSTSLGFLMFLQRSTTRGICSSQVRSVLPTQVPLICPKQPISSRCIHACEVSENGGLSRGGGRVPPNVQAASKQANPGLPPIPGEEHHPPNEEVLTEFLGWCYANGEWAPSQHMAQFLNARHCSWRRA